MTLIVSRTGSIRTLTIFSADPRRSPNGFPYYLHHFKIRCRYVFPDYGIVSDVVVMIAQCDVIRQIQM
ncbi:MAG: hypothetical protein RBQ72_13700, partial [Desulfobacterium sp.]|nr:hypothetical protein [Desulfobacterium sp.]